MVDQVLKVRKREIVLTNPDKILFPKSKITKADFVDYYTQIAQTMVPFIKGHLLTMLRFPDGIDEQKFFQKQVPEHFPDWVARVPVPLKTIKKTDDYVLCNDPETLVYLANYVCVPHMWLSCFDKLDLPDRIVFDLDPANKKGFNVARVLALRLQKILNDLGLEAFPMLTGSSGMHVIVPIKRTKPFDEVRVFAQSVAQLLVDEYPKLYTLEMSVAKRGTRVFIDTLRNSFGATSVAPYAIRDKEGAPVATSISWDEVHDSKLSSQRYNYQTIFKKLAHEPDPWANFAKSAVSLTEPIKQLAKILKSL